MFRFFYFWALRRFHIWHFGIRHFAIRVSASLNLHFIAVVPVTKPNTASNDLRFFFFSLTLSNTFLRGFMFVGSFGAKVLHNFVCAVAVFLQFLLLLLKASSVLWLFQIAFQLCHPLRFEVQTLFNRKYFLLISFQCGCGRAATDRCHDCRSFVLSKHPHTVFFHFLSLYRRFASFFAPPFPPTHQKNIFHVEY